MRHTFRMLPLALAGALSLGLLSGCGGGGEPTATPEEPSALVSESLSPAPTESPALSESAAPEASESPAPSQEPSAAHSEQPETPSNPPSAAPTAQPTAKPSAAPKPSSAPTPAPTPEPTQAPSASSVLESVWNDIAQNELPMRKWVYRFVVATMYFNAGLIPWYILMVNLGLKNNFLLYILPSAVGAYYVVLSKTYIESIPASVEESAKIDGAGVLTIYARLILPMSMPIIACLIVFCAVNQWNAWSDNFYLVSDPKLSTLQYQLYMNLANESSNVTNTTSSSSLLRSKATTELGLRYALSMLTVLPIILVYPFMQKYFVKGIMLGAVKG